MADKNLSSFSSRSLTRKDMRLDFKSSKSFLLCQVSFNLQVLMPHSIKKNHSSLAEKKTVSNFVQQGSGLRVPFFPFLLFFSISTLVWTLRFIKTEVLIQHSVQLCSVHIKSSVWEKGIKKV